jgi:hypothetical protein
MLDRQNQGPQCTACGSPMKLTAIEPGALRGQDLRTFTCPKCKGVQRHLVDSTVTEAWLEPQLFIKGQHGNAVTFEVRDGRMIPSQPVKTF